MSPPNPIEATLSSAPSLLQVIQPADPPPLGLYLQAVDILVSWQAQALTKPMPVGTSFVPQQALAMFPHWYIREHRKVSLEPAAQQTLDKAFTDITAQVQIQPQVLVHQDFTPSTLWIAPDGSLATPDFPHAVPGPITYDIASLMRAAFVGWEEDFCLDVTIRYWEKARKAGLPVGTDFGEFYRAVEWTGLLRHLMLAGDFVRQSTQGDRPELLAELPRFMAYAWATCNRYRELKPLQRLIERLEGIEAPSGYSFGRL